MTDILKTWYPTYLIQFRLKVQRFCDEGFKPGGICNILQFGSQGYYIELVINYNTKLESEALKFRARDIF